jgi:hypothetical protein
MGGCLFSIDCFNGNVIGWSTFLGDYPYKYDIVQTYMLFLYFMLVAKSATSSGRVAISRTCFSNRNWVSKRTFILDLLLHCVLAIHLDPLLCTLRPLDSQPDDFHVPGFHIDQHNFA